MSEKTVREAKLTNWKKLLWLIFAPNRIDGKWYFSVFFAQKIKNNWHWSISLGRLWSVNYGKNYNDSVQCSHPIQSPGSFFTAHIITVSDWNTESMKNEKWIFIILIRDTCEIQVLWQKILTALSRTQSTLSVIAGIIKFLFPQLSQCWSWRIICLFLMSFLNLTICRQTNHVIRIKL